MIASILFLKPLLQSRLQRKRIRIQLLQAGTGAHSVMYNETAFRFLESFDHLRLSC